MQAIEKKAISALRVLAAESVEKAKSGHPGMAIGSAPIVYAIWKQMKLDPRDPQHPYRDRFVLSAGHVSALHYAALHLFGYGVGMEDMKQFRQLGSNTPGHPEYGETPGVEATTGPLGQGIAMAAGMALAESRLAAHFNCGGLKLVDNYTYVLCGDGCLMEGVAWEAISFAGQNRLGKLILFYDRNRITIEGELGIASSDDVEGKFRAMGWQVLHVADGDDLPAIEEALSRAKTDTEHPSVVIVDTVIGRGTPKAGKSSAHGEPLGPEALEALKESCGWSLEPGSGFEIPAEVYAHYHELAETCRGRLSEYDRLLSEYRSGYPELYEEWCSWHETTCPEKLKQDERLFAAEKPEATRASSGKVLNLLAEYYPNLFGGSADLAPSNKTELKGRSFYSPENRDGSNLHFGIREFAMAAMCNGMALYGGLRPFCATFMVFSDYLKPAARLSALMKLPVWYVLTHDSIGVGEDGPTHEPVEQLPALRSIPGMRVYRPADLRETAWSYLSALDGKGPSAFVLSRQNLPQLPGTGEGVQKGGYVLKEGGDGSPKVILIGTGSELQLAVKAAEKLETEGISTRVVSMPCMELFNQQSAEYRESVLPRGVRARVSVEAGSSFGWDRYVGLDGACVCIDRFGASGPAAKLFEEYGITADAVAEAAKKVLRA